MKILFSLLLLIFSLSSYPEEVSDEEIIKNLDMIQNIEVLKSSSDLILLNIEMNDVKKNEMEKTK